MTTTPKPTIVVMEALSGSCSAVVVAGGVPRRVSPRDQSFVVDALESRDYDGLLLTGGGDVNPARYGKKPHKNVYGVSDDRDWCEIYALEIAREMSIPVLGICRGSQIMNVEAGGDLRQHIGGHHGEHPVAVQDGSILLRATGNETRPIVKSLHHQEVLHCAPGWQISGRAPDGTAEAVESLDGRCLGVQFHPEMHQSHEYARNIFRWLVEEAATRSGKPVPPRTAIYPSKGKRRSAARRATASNSWTPNVGTKVTYFCPFDGIRFDNRQDQLDHLVFIHSVTPDDSGRIVSEIRA